MPTLNQGYTNKYRDQAILLLVISLGAIWNIPNIITARYACEGLLVILLLTYKINWTEALKKIKILIIFFIYLLIQLLFFSTDLASAFRNFKSEWMHFVIFSFIGIGSGIVLSQYKKNTILLVLGLGFAFPLFIHIFLMIIKGISITPVPWGRWGINKTHGDLAYASLQASILLIAYLSYQCKSRIQFIFIFSTLVICFLSPLIAKSRGGIIFYLLIIFTSVFLFSYLSNNLKFKRLYLFSFIFISLLMGISATIINIYFDPDRWSNLALKAQVGFMGDPSSIICKGVEPIENSIINKKGLISEQEQIAINSVLDGDGARVMVARSGIQLIRENIMGINASKQAYQIAISKYCGSIPKIFISHAHNAWIDTSLAIGVIGALILMGYYITLAKFGLKHIIYNNEINPFSFALFLTAFIWLLRGLLDSTLRDQMLEMQAFILPFLFILSYKFMRK